MMTWNNDGPTLRITRRHPAVTLALQLRDEYGLSRSATLAEFYTVCRRRGIAVLVIDGMKKPGVYIPWPTPIIALQSPPCPFVGFHEVYHDCEFEAREMDLSISCYGRRPPDREDAANVFGAIIAPDGMPYNLSPEIWRVAGPIYYETRLDDLRNRLIEAGYRSGLPERVAVCDLSQAEIDALLESQEAAFLAHAGRQRHGYAWNRRVER